MSEPKTELSDRLTRIETLVDGGPGMHPICLRHAADVVEIKKKLDTVAEKVQMWSAGLAILMVFLNLVGPLIVKKVFGP